MIFFRNQKFSRQI